MSNARDVIVRPLITEKSMNVGETNNTVVFEVKKGANKILVKQAVESIFGVKVESVNVVNTKPKTKRVGRYEGTTKAIRKAYVKLAKGHNITILEDK